MIQSVTIVNPLGETLVLELGKPEKSGFLVREIRGLGPVKADISMNSVATADGSFFASARANNRNIIFELEFLEKPTIEATRQLSYKHFPLKKEVEMIFKTDRRTVSTTGYVESNEPDIFSKEESTQISILCPDAYFHSVSDLYTVFSGLDYIFEFPFSNDSLVEDLTMFAEIKRLTNKDIIYKGEVDVGFSMMIHATGTVKDLIIQNTRTEEYMRIDTNILHDYTGEYIIDGDDIYIDTVQGNKSMFLLRSGVWTNIINCLTLDSTWLILRPGVNTFEYTASQGTLDLEFQIVSRVGYEGA